MKYRFILTTISLLLSVSFCGFAQLETSSDASNEEPNKFRTLKHSFGFGIVGGGELRGGIWPMPGMGYKYHMEDGAIRVMVGGIINNSFSSGQGFASNYAESGFNVRVGYQYHVMLGRFMPIIGVDLAGGYYNRSNFWATGSDEVTNMTLGLSPNLGLEFWISPKLSVLLDTRFDVSFQDYTSHYISTDPWWPQDNLTRSTGLATHISPISSFMAIFHF